MDQCAETVAQILISVDFNDAGMGRRGSRKLQSHGCEMQKTRLQGGLCGV